VLALAEENSFSSLRSLARIVIGAARAQLDRTDEGVSLIRQGLVDLAELGARIGFTAFLTGLAEAQALDGATLEALGTIEEALQVNPDELVFRPSMMTCRGELRLKLGETGPAEADFREAMALAQKMGAKAFELRAATSLARLLTEQGKRDKARATLTPIYNWFTEGFDTADLKDAKALLDGSPT
jgi:predicted ATPase